MSQFEFTKLDVRTRNLMVEEILLAKDSDNLYYSARFNDHGNENWPDWLLSAAKGHDEQWLEHQLEAESSMKQFETKAKRKGGYTQAHVPETAAETFADVQFNRFYIAAICRRAMEDGKSAVRIYRARQRGKPRLESRALEGTLRDATSLLRQVRSRQGSLDCDLLKPNSGLSAGY